MAWLSQEKRKGRAPWRVKWQTPDGRERSRSFTDKRIAKAFLRDVDAELERGEWIAPELANVTVAEWCDHAITSWNDLRPSSRARAESAINGQIKPRLGAVPLAAVDAVVLRRWVNDLVASGLAPATVRKAWQTLSRVMADAVPERIAASPCTATLAKRVLPKVERHEARFLTPPEVRQLADAIGPDWSPLVYLGATCGLRIGELLALQWRDVHADVKRPFVEVRATVAEANGVQHVNQPKTSAGRRRVPMPRVCVDAMRAHKVRTAGSRFDLVFPQANGNHWRATNFRNRVWRPAVARVGLVGLVPHELRHSAVAAWIETGASANEVAKRAGHEDARVVLSVYGHLFPESEERVTDAMDALYAVEDVA